MRARLAQAGRYALCPACGKPSQVPVTATPDNNASFGVRDLREAGRRRLSLPQLLLTAGLVAALALAPVKALQVQAQRQQISECDQHAIATIATVNTTIRAELRFAEYDRVVRTASNAMARLAATAPRGAAASLPWRLSQRALRELVLARDIWAAELVWQRTHGARADMPVRSGLRRQFADLHPDKIGFTHLTHTLRASQARHTCWSGAVDCASSAMGAGFN